MKGMILLHQWIQNVFLVNWQVHFKIYKYSLCKIQDGCHVYFNCLYIYHLLLLQIQAVSSQTNPTVPPVMNNDPQMPVGDVYEQVCCL